MIDTTSDTAQIGAAGPLGDDVRSDLHVRVERLQDGGLQVELESKVGALYGQSIRDAVRRVLGALDVQHARVVIVDRGALPFTVAARIEAAARRSGAPGSGDARPEQTLARSGRTARTALRRSRLYLPGGQPKLMINAGLHRPDAVILDLEDSVHPDDKDAARLVVRNALRCIDFMGAERMVRINQLPLGFDDLDAVVPEGPDLILIPKVEKAEQVRAVHDRIESIQRERTDTVPIWLMPIIESALGVEHAFQVASAADSVAAITIGLEDYTADLGVRKTREGDESLYARMRLVNAAHAARIQAIDSVYGDVDDVAGLTIWATRSRSLGFEGMGCIHPRQIPTIHDAFAPSEDEIERALAIVAAFEEAESKSLGVVRLGTKMIDLPVVLRARRLVKNATDMGLLVEMKA